MRNTAIRNRNTRPIVQACLAALGVLGISTAAHAATVTSVMTEHFNGSLNPLLTQNGGVTVSGGYADLDGVNGNTLAGGYYMDISSYTATDGGAGPEGGGPSVSWIMEAVIGPDAVAGSDGMGAAPSSNDVIFSFNGRYGLRFNTTQNWSLFYRPAGGASDVNTGIPLEADRPSAGSHIAIVFSNDGATDTLAYYKDGVLGHSISGDFNRYNIARAGFGLEINSGASLSRGFNGTFDSIAFSTFTGTFDPGTDLVLIPEPSTSLLTLLGLIGLPLYRRFRVK